MRTKRHRLVVERLEERQLLTGNIWFEDSEQQLGTNTINGGAEFGDLDADGDLDLLVSCANLSGGPSCSETQVWLNDGSGQFSAGWSGPVTNVSDLALGDLDGDGDLDAFFSKGQYQRVARSEIWLNDGSGNFELGQRINGSATFAALGDIDGDGDLDAITSIPEGPGRVWLNNGSGELTDSGQRLAPNASFHVALGDVDGDGDLDAYFGRGPVSPTDWLYLNDGRGNFTDSGQSLESSFGGSVALGDLDGDNDLDLFAANAFENPDRVYLNDGTGKFSDSGQELGPLLGASWVALGDLDGDGDLDAVVANGNAPLQGPSVEVANEVWLNNGSGLFTIGQELGLGHATLRGVALGDIDNDGDLDALFVSSDEGNQIWFNTGLTAGDANRDGVFNQLDVVQVLQSAKYQTEQPATWAEGDFNRDGVFDQLDIVAALQSGKYRES